MLIDHAAILLFDDLYIMRLIGRLAFLLFSWFIVLGMQRSQNKIKYMRNLLILAIVSQPIYMMSGIDPHTALNIVFQLLAASITIQGIKIDTLTCKIRYAPLSMIIALPLAYFSEYGLAGYALILSLYMMHKYEDLKILNIWNGREYKLGSYFIFLVILALLVNLQIVFWPVIPLFLYLIYSKIDQGIRYRKSFKYYFYAFYPVHLMILHVMSTIL